MMKTDCIAKFDEVKSQYDACIAALAYIPDELENLVEASCIRLPELTIKIGWDTEELRRVRRLLGKDWHFIKTWSNNGEMSQSGSIFRCFEYHCKYNDAHLTLTMRAETNSPVCRIEQIGVKELPILQVVCN